MVRFTSAVRVAASLLLFAGNSVAQTQNNSVAASSFVSSDGFLSFALNIPEDEGSDELYFTLQGTDASWIAVGMGNDMMANSLIFMAYPDSTGKNVTLSPRLSNGNVEPVYIPDVSITVLPGTSYVNDTIKVNAKCGNCRKWKTGSIDPTSSATSFIFASGPDSGSINSNSLSTGVKRHTSYGSFLMDLSKAVGPAGVPDHLEASTPGSSETSNQMDRRDFSGAAHAILMVLTFVGLLPGGVVILRVFKSPKWHGIAQGLSMAMALAGMVIGIMMGMKYNRTKGFNTPHQIIGLIVMTALIGQFVLGFLHHRIYTKSQTISPSSPSPSKLAPIHIWLGRFVILFGIINGFLGFPLAMNPRYDLALLAVLLFVVIIFGPFAFWRYRRDLKKKKAGSSSDDDGYQSQPWVNSTAGGQSRSNIELGQMQFPPPYQGQPAQQGRQFV